MSKKIIIFGALVIIMAIAAFFRVWQLDKIPPGIYPDEAMNGTNALDVARDNQFKVYYPENNGREGLLINILALTFKYGHFQPTAVILRIWSVIFGTLTVLGLYLLVKELFYQPALLTPSPNKKNRWLSMSGCLALISAFLLAISFWHVNFSRISFRAILAPFLMVFCFYFLWRYFRRGKILSLILSGIFFGLGFYTYIAFRVVPALIIIAWLPRLWPWWKCHRKNKNCCSPETQQYCQPTKWQHLITYILVILIVITPIARFFIIHPEQFMGRASDVAVWKTNNPIKDSALSIVKTLGMFNIHGDCNWRHNYACQPQLLWPEGIFFLIGLILIIRNIILRIKKKTQQLFPNFHVSIFILSWFVFMLLPATLTAEGLPHALRALGVIPIAYVLTALGLIMPYTWAQNKLNATINASQIGLKNQPINQIKRIKIFLAILLVLILAALGVYQYQKYFVGWANDPNVASAFTQSYVQIGQFLNFYADKGVPRYVIVNENGTLVNGIPVSAQTIKYITYDKGEITYLLPSQLDKIQVSKDKKVNALIVLMQDDPILLKEIQQQFPKNITGSAASFGEFRFISI